MKRTTIVLPDDLGVLLEAERRRRDTSAAAIVREALELYLRGGDRRPGRLPFIGLGDSGHADTAERLEEILAEERSADLDRDR